MDPDTEPVVSETIGKIQIRIRKNYFGSTFGQVRILNDFEINYSD